MLRKHPTGGRLLLCITTLGFVLTMGISFLKLREYEEIGRIELSETTWAAAQIRYEFLRFSSTLDLYVQPSSSLSKDDLLHRFDILFSRLPVFLEGPEGKRYAAVPGLQNTVRGLLMTLESLEPRLRELRKGDFERYDTLRQEFADQATSLSELIVSALVQDEGTTAYFNTALEQTYLTLMIAFAGILVSGTGLIALLLRETAAARAAENAAQAAGLRLRVAIDSIPDGFVLYDAADCLILCNDKFVEFCQPAADVIRPGVSFEEFIRTLVAAGALSGASGDVDSRVAQRRDLCTASTGSFEERMADGRWLRISEQRTPDGGIVSVLTDITELKRREEALRDAKDNADRANHAKTAFLATMSHELRTPLNAVIGFSDMMAQEVFGPIGDPHYAEYAQDIRNSGQHLLAIINDILDMAKIESGKLEMSEAWFALSDLITETLRLLRERARAAGIELMVEMGAELPVLQGDQQLIRQVLLNLYSNALKFTPPGGRVHTEINRRSDGSVVVRITDTGIGIAPADLARVLQPFVQVENYLQRRHEGTGLGLPLVKAMIELHGGTFELDSVLGAGTTATVTFPACRISPLPLSSSELRLSAPPVSLSNNHPHDTLVAP
jgi:signal transduction histidine kinase